MKMIRSVPFTKTLPAMTLTAPPHPRRPKITLLGLGAVLVGTPMGADQPLVTWCVRDGWSWSSRS